MVRVLWIRVSLVEALRLCMRILQEEESGRFPVRSEGFVGVKNQALVPAWGPRKGG